MVSKKASDILATPKGRIIKLADDKEYTLAPFNLNTLANLEEAFDCDLDKLEEKLSGRTATAFRKLLWVLLREDYPKMTLIEVGKLVQLDQMTDLVEELTAALGELKT